MPEGRILAVDDQRYFRELIEGLLQEEGYELELASSGEEALQRLDRESFDVVITDLVMPVMSGTDLVHRIKERDPNQDVVVVTGVVDVQSAVEAMKVGADDYLLKPFDRQALVASIEGIFKHRKLQRERDRLLEENIEYISERSLFERALDLFGSFSQDTLAPKILEALEAETGAQSSVLWLEAEEGGALQLAAARGLVEIDAEKPQLGRDTLPAALRGTRGRGGSLLEDEERTLWIGLSHEDRVIGAVRLSDKLGDDCFDELDQACAGRFSKYAERALGNAACFRMLERRTLEDPQTGAYRIEYLRDVVRNEVEKANRFGRTFGLAVVGVGDLDRHRAELDAAAFSSWWAGFVRAVARQLRATDFLAVDGDYRVWVRLAESDAVGAATFKRRTRLALEACDALGPLPVAAQSQLQIATAIYPRDASRLETLESGLRSALADDGRAAERDMRFDRLSFAECLHALLAEGEDELEVSAASLMRFSLSEAGRRPSERNLFFCRPGSDYLPALEAASRRPEGHGCEIIVVADPPTTPSAPDVAWLPAARLAGCPPFAVHYGDGPAYVLVCDEKSGPSGRRLYHSSDAGLAEYLAFRLQRELRLPTLV
jgi:DNA-binding response OmpR family regulator